MCEFCYNISEWRQEKQGLPSSIKYDNIYESMKEEMEQRDECVSDFFFLLRY